MFLCDSGCQLWRARLSLERCEIGGVLAHLPARHHAFHNQALVKKSVTSLIENLLEFPLELCRASKTGRLAWKEGQGTSCDYFTNCQSLCSAISADTSNNCAFYDKSITFGRKANRGILIRFKNGGASNRVPREIVSHII